MLTLDVSMIDERNASFLSHANNHCFFDPVSITTVTRSANCSVMRFICKHLQFPGI